MGVGLSSEERWAVKSERWISVRRRGRVSVKAEAYFRTRIRTKEEYRDDKMADEKWHEI